MPIQGPASDNLNAQAAEAIQNKQDPLQALPSKKTFQSLLTIMVRQAPQEMDLRSLTSSLMPKTLM